MPVLQEAPFVGPGRIRARWGGPVQGRTAHPRLKLRGQRTLDKATCLEILDDPTAEEGKEQVPYKRDVASRDSTLEKRSINPIETTFAGECD
jgi:hypothetical protein